MEYVIIEFVVMKGGHRSWYSVDVAVTTVTYFNSDGINYTNYHIAHYSINKNKGGH